MEQVVVYENIPYKFDIGHCRTKVKVTFEIFLHLPQYKLSGPITTLVQARKLILSVYVYRIII